MEFPDWSDLGQSSEGQDTESWEQEMLRLNRSEHYYSGNVFLEYAEKERPSDPDLPLFPAGINLVKYVCHALTDSMFGDWPEKPIQFIGTDQDGTDKKDLAATELADAILRESAFLPQLWEAELDRNKFGGCALRASVDFGKAHKVRWSRVHRNTFFPVWDPEDQDNLLEVWVVTKMSAAQVKAKLNVAVEKPTNYVEHWTVKVHETFLGDERTLHEYNPYGVVPFVYIPRLRSENWWGDSVTEDVIALQDEINIRVADIGDISANDAHPIKWGKNLPRGFNRDNFPTGSDKMWDLGRKVGDFDPEVGVLEPRHTSLPTVFEMVRLLLKFSRDAAQTPSIAYGDDDGGGQRSADTLEMRIRSMLAAVKRSRAYMTAGIERMLKITAAIMEQKKFPGIPSGAVERLKQITCVYAEILPRRQPELVDEVVKLLSTDPPTISLETAISLLGRNPGREQELIAAMMTNQAIWRRYQEPSESEKMAADAKAQKADKKPDKGATGK